MNYAKLIFTLLITFISAINCAEEANPWAELSFYKMQILKENFPGLSENPTFLELYKSRKAIKDGINSARSILRRYVQRERGRMPTILSTEELQQRIEGNKRRIEILQQSEASLKQSKASAEVQPNPTDRVVIHAKPIGARMLKSALASYYTETNIAADEMDESDDRDLLPFKKEIKRCQAQAAARAKIEEARKLKEAIEGTKAAEIERLWLREKARNAKREAIMRRESDEYVRTHPQVDPDDLDEIQARALGLISPGYIRERTMLETMNPGIKVRLFTDIPYRFR